MSAEIPATPSPASRIRAAIRAVLTLKPARGTLGTITSAEGARAVVAKRDGRPLRRPDEALAPSETLRRAAVLMRERANAATDGPWEPWSGAVGGGGEYVTTPRDSSYLSTARGGGYTFGITPGLAGDAGWEIARRDAAHIASWHPAVALAVADLLDDAAESFDRHMARMTDPQQRFRHIWLATARQRHEHAIAVARAYLGEDA